MEVQGIKTGAQVTAFFFIPPVRLTIVAKVAGKGRHIVSGIGEAEHVVADKFAGSLVTESTVIVVKRDNRKLFDKETVGAADKIRTCDLDLRRVALCSAELQPQMVRPERIELPSSG